MLEGGRERSSKVLQMNPEDLELFRRFLVAGYNNTGLETEQVISDVQAYLSRQDEEDRVYLINEGFPRVLKAVYNQ